MIAVLVKDLIFRTSIEGAAKRAKKEIVFLEGLERAQGSGTVIVDLEEFPREDVRRFKAENPETKLIGYLSHRQVGLKEKSLREGFDLVLARSEFVKRLDGILRGKMD